MMLDYIITSAVMFPCTSSSAKRFFLNSITRSWKEGEREGWTEGGRERQRERGPERERKREREGRGGRKERRERGEKEIHKHRHRVALVTTYH